jgi:hypothetical protein
LDTGREEGRSQRLTRKYRVVIMANLSSNIKWLDAARTFNCLQYIPAAEYVMDLQGKLKEILQEARQTELDQKGKHATLYDHRLSILNCDKCVQCKIKYKKDMNMGFYISLA